MLPKAADKVVATVGRLKLLLQYFRDPVCLDARRRCIGR